MILRRTTALRAALAAGLVLTLGACGIFGSSKPDPLPGERIPVLLTGDRATVDPRLAELAVRLPRPIENLAWPQQGGAANHAMHHLALVEAPSRAWSSSAGSGSSDEEPILSGPVVVDGRIYVKDAEAVVTAWDAAKGSRLWSVDLEPDNEPDGNWGGGVAWDAGRLYASTGFAQVIALDPNSGNVLWRQNVSAPVRGAPTAFNNRVYAVTRDNQLFALDAATGQVLWQHTGIEETAGLLGSSSPAVEGDIVVVAYSSGELFALRAENGRQLWSDNLAAIRRADAVSALADIRGRPVIDRGRVYAISHSGRTVAIDLPTGRRLWEAAIGGENQPWIAGDFLFVLSTDGDVVCMTARDGRVRWLTALGLYDDPEDKEGRIQWSGPVLAGDRLIVTGSHGRAIALSPYSGEIIGEISISGGVSLAPAVADGALYFLTDDADLVVYR
ncbi:MAG: PQQ-binding-like beta-propeller repeat protein [Alphaproteobacteria bacterium]